MVDILRRIKNVFRAPKSEEVATRLGIDFVAKLGITEARLGGLAELENCTDPDRMERIAHTFATVYLKPKVAEVFLNGIRRIKIVIDLQQNYIKKLERQLATEKDPEKKKKLEETKRLCEFLRKRAIDQLRQYIYRFYISSFRAKDLDLSHTIILKGEGRSVSVSFGGGLELGEMEEVESEIPEGEENEA